MEVTELCRLRLLEEMNQRLKRLVADLCLNKKMLPNVIRKNSEAPQQREAVEYLQATSRISVRRGYHLMMQSRTVYHYRSHRDDRAITKRRREIAETRIRYGYQRIHILLRQEEWLIEEWLINDKKTHRNWREVILRNEVNKKARKP